METMPTTSTVAPAPIVSPDPGADLRFRLLWVDEVNGDEVYGMGPAPIDPLAA